MKSRVALIAAAMLASAVALAHDGPRGHRGPDMDRMAVLLDLNDSQKAEVQKIFDEQRDKLKVVHEQQRSAGTRPTREEREKFHAEMKQDTTTRLQAVLSADQMKKFAALTEHSRRHRGHDDDSQ
jgi:Spy/CpxP family protein refolding chaperone